MTASKKCSSTTFTEVDIGHRMTSANVVHRDLDLYFQGHKISGTHIYYLENGES